jgi:hypothetical protein
LHTAVIVPHKPANRCNSQERSATDLALSLDPVRTLPYSVNIMGVDCPISHASSGLAEIWATEIDGSAELEFKEFKYNPLNQGTGKPLRGGQAA